MSSAEPGASVPPDSINFVYENNARRILLPLFKQIPHAARAHAHKHFHEVRARNGEERNVRLSRNRASQQSLACSRRPDQQNALRNASAKLLEFLRIFQKLDNFLQLFLGFIGSRNIL